MTHPRLTRVAAGAVGALLAGLTLALTLAALTLAGPASAHDELVATSPTDGSSVAAPRQVVLTFAEAVLGVGDRIAVTGPSGQVHSGAPTAQGSTLSATLPPLPAGGYRVTWRAVSADGHPVSGSFGFTVTSPSTTPPSTTAPTATPLTATPLTTPTPSATPAPSSGTGRTQPASNDRLQPVALGLLALGALTAAAAVAIARWRPGQGRG